MRVIREEAAYVSNNLAGQLAAEREKCYELEVMAEQKFQTVNHGAANVTNHLVGQLAAERKRCQELEFMAEQQFQTTSQEYAVEIQRLRGTNDLLAGEQNLACEKLARCQQEFAVREAMLQEGKEKAAGLVDRKSVV